MSQKKISLNIKSKAKMLPWKMGPLVIVLIAISSNCWASVGGVANIPLANKSEIETIAANKPKQDGNKDSQVEKISLPEYMQKQHLRLDE